MIDRLDSYIKLALSVAHSALILFGALLFDLYAGISLVCLQTKCVCMFYIHLGVKVIIMESISMPDNWERHAETDRNGCPGALSGWAVLKTRSSWYFTRHFEENISKFVVSIVPACGLAFHVFTELSLNGWYCIACCYSWDKYTTMICCL